jgi:cephalosporin hydroxylase
MRMTLKERFYRWITPDRHLLKWLIYQRIYVNPKLKRRIVDQFHKFYYDFFVFGETWGRTFWLGIPAQKLPMDLWIYQEIIYEIKPDVIIETGTECGGSALFLASICDLVQNGKVISIDVAHREGNMS